MGRLEARTRLALTAFQFCWSESHGARPGTLPFDGTWNRIAVHPVGAVADMIVAAFIIVGTVAGADFCLRRHFHRLHAVTWVVVVVLGSGLIYGNVLQSRWIFYHLKGHYFRGWPNPHTEDRDSPASLWEDLDRIYAPNLVKNIAWSVVLLASPVILVERWARRRFRMTIRGMLIAMIFFAVILWVIPARSFVALPEFLVWRVSTLTAAICALALVALFAANTRIRVCRVMAGKVTPANTSQPQNPPPADQPGD